MPPVEGVFFQNDLFYYDGSAGRGRQFTIGGNVVAKLDARVIVDFPTLVWVPSTSFLGGTLAVSASLPFGGPQIDAGARLTGPGGGVIERSASDTATRFGDPYLSSFVGWQTGNFHWQTGASLNVPVGDYHKGALANLAFNKWAGDFFAAATWLDPAIGLDVSGKVGFTVNGRNPSTDYNPGNDFHAEWAVEQHFSKAFSAGVVGYYYKQVSGDTGSGAVLGSFKGETVALGGTVGFNFELGKLPVASRLKVYRELDATRRLKGTAAFFTLSAPLYVSQSAAIPLTTKQ
ncbi:transporter [Hansschlegelia quercus]|nr:transporter [Hansschlegelia quercus]